MNSLLELAQVARDRTLSAPEDDLGPLEGLRVAERALPAVEESAVLYARWDQDLHPRYQEERLFPTGYGIIVGPDLPQKVDDWVQYVSDDWGLLLQLYLPFRPPDPEDQSNDQAAGNWEDHRNRVKRLLADDESVTDAEFGQIRAFYTSRPPGLPRTRAQRREYRKWESKGGLPIEIPLVEDDEELRAAILLRCAQQGYSDDEAMVELEEYTRRQVRSKEEADQSAAYLAVEQAVRNIVDLEPNALPQYLARAYMGTELEEKKTGLSKITGWEGYRETRARELEGDRPEIQSQIKAKDSRAEREEFRYQALYTRKEAAEVLKVTPRRIWQMVDEGKLEAVETWPLRLNRAEVDRLAQERSESTGNRSVLYDIVQAVRDCSRDAARMWVVRRRDKGLSDEEILEEAAEQAGIESWDNFEAAQSSSSELPSGPGRKNVEPFDVLSIGYGGLGYVSGDNDMSVTFVLAVDVASGLLCGWTVDETMNTEAALLCWEWVEEIYAELGQPLSKVTVRQNQHPVFRAKRWVRTVQAANAEIEHIIPSSSTKQSEMTAARSRLDDLRGWLDRHPTSSRSWAEHWWRQISWVANYKLPPLWRQDVTPVEYLRKQDIEVPEEWGKANSLLINK